MDPTRVSLGALDLLVTAIAREVARRAQTPAHREAAANTEQAAVKEVVDLIQQAVATEAPGYRLRAVSTHDVAESIATTFERDPVARQGAIQLAGEVVQAQPRSAIIEVPVPLLTAATTDDPGSTAGPSAGIGSQVASTILTPRGLHVFELRDALERQSPNRREVQLGNLVFRELPYQDWRRRAPDLVRRNTAKRVPELAAHVMQSVFTVGLGPTLGISPDLAGHILRSFAGRPPGDPPTPPENPVPGPRPPW
jgi:hypothetical protein